MVEYPGVENVKHAPTYSELRDERNRCLALELAAKTILVDAAGVVGLAKTFYEFLSEVRE